MEIIKKDEPRYLIPLKDGSLYELKAEDLAMFKQVYTHIYVEHEIRKMIAWAVSNPSQRKTKRGIMRFVNGWLNRAKPEQSVTQRQYIQSTTLEERLSDDSWAH